MRNFLILAFAGAAVLTQSAGAQTAPGIPRAIGRALPPLEKSAAAFVAKRACVSCHHNILPILMLHLAQDRGVAIDATVLAAVEAKTFRALRGPSAFDDAVQAATLNDPTPGDSYLLMAADAAGVPADPANGVYARRIAQWQRDGHWVTSDFRPPHSSSLFTATATAVRAIGLYMPPELAAERDACIVRAREWLSRTRPSSTEDATFRLLGLVWAGAAAREINAARSDLLAMRLSSAGAWPQLSGYPADAYSTGEALFALRESGMAAFNPVWRAGAAFLLKTQAQDGTWRVATRMVSPAEVSPQYFPTGFPYEKDEFLSYAGSSWAVMALLSALPETGRAVHSIVAPPPAPAWARTALFGTPQQLRALLDAGLDPNSKTPKGTTLLMMAATDPDKVRLLLTRHADPKARSVSGYDALTIAAASRNTAASIKELLDAGAEANPPASARAKNTPLLYASMTGDLANARLLLDRGAEPSAAALSQAVTFGYADIVRALIAAGAPAKLTEGTGINMLHWAVIANRPAVIPALAAAGVPVNAKDENGFTPLMYAATIDFGDTRSIDALLKAGADPAIRNADGRTAIEQARRYLKASADWPAALSLGSSSLGSDQPRP